MAAVRDDEHNRTEEDKNREKNMMTMKKKNKYEKSYFDVSGLCCSSEVPLIEKLLKPMDGVIQISVIVPSRTLIVVHDSLLVSQSQIVKVLNGARLEANVRVHGGTNFRQKWPSPYAVGCGLLLLLSLLKFVYHPFQWLALTAVAFGVFPMALKGVAALRHFRLDVNILMLIAVIGTIALNDYLEAGTIVFLFSIAEWLESRASHKATAVMSALMSIAPKRAVIAETGEEVAIEDVKINTVLAVKAGEMVPIDGVITEGKCEVDEKTLTGESFPAAKEKGSVVWAGTVNLNGYISVKTTVLGEDCVVSRMAKLVEEAQNHKSRSQRIIDRCAKYYTPAIVLLSAGLAGVPAAMQIHNRNHWFRLALVVLVSACPCALILSTPVATFCALSKAATVGLLIKGGDYLETLAKIKTVAFDKTGTITKGEFVVTDFHSFCDDVSPNTLLYWVSSIESKSSHPLAAALVDYARSHSITPTPENVKEFQIFPGEGVLGKIDGKEIYVGNKKIAERAGCETDPKLGCMINGGSTNASIYSDSACIGIFKLSDVCRSGVAEAIKELKSMGIRSSMVTGDNQAAAMQIQNQLENALDVVHAELLPEDKANIIKSFQSEGQCTAMVGDGVNDALALAMADIGVSMGISGSALATETGNVILMSNDVRKIPQAIKLARRSRRKVIENITLSIFTKAAIIGLACAGHPLVWAAVLGDVGTCLLVIFNSMLLLRGTHHHRENCSRFPSHHHSPHNNHSHYCSKPSIQQTLIRQQIPCESKCCESLSKHSSNKHSNCCSKPSIQQTPIRQQIPCESKCCESLSKHSSNKHSNCCPKPSVGQQLTTTKTCASQCCSSPRESECCKSPLSKHTFHSPSDCSSDPVLGRQQTMMQIYASQCKSKCCENLNQDSSHSQSHCISDPGDAQQSTMAQICASQCCPSPCKNKCTESLGRQHNRCIEGNDVHEAQICANEGFHQTGWDHGPHSKENCSDCKVHAHSKDSLSHDHNLGAASGLNSIVASTAAVHGCMGMETREVGCKSCREECRGREGYKVEANFGVPLTEIITE